MKLHDGPEAVLVTAVGGTVSVELLVVALVERLLEVVLELAVEEVVETTCALTKNSVGMVISTAVGTLKPVRSKTYRVRPKKPVPR